MFHGTTKFCFK